MVRSHWRPGSRHGNRASAGVGSVVPRQGSPRSFDVKGPLCDRLLDHPRQGGEPPLTPPAHG